MQSVELAELQREKDNLLEVFENGFRFEKEREYDMDYLYQQAIVNSDEDMYAETSPELMEIREEQKRLFNIIQEERENFKFFIRQRTNEKLEELDQMMVECRESSEDE